MVDWEAWQKHVDHIVAERGRWFGIGDGDGKPLFSLDVPSSQVSPEQWMDSADLEITLPATTPDLEPTLAAQKLFFDGLSGFDISGKPLRIADEDYTLLVAMPGPDGRVVRRGGLITHTTADDPENSGVPKEITIHALNCMDVWNTIPAASWPAAWWAAKPYPRKKDEAGIEYPESWLMAKIEMATKSNFTFKQGKAGFVIRRLAQESLDAAMMTQEDPGGPRWVDDPYHVVEVPEADSSPEILLEARDGMLWETVAGQAKNAGVILGARMWWPGDPPVRCWTPATSSMTPEQVDISPSAGAPHRALAYRSFPHAMVVLTVKEVA